MHENYRKRQDGDLNITKRLAIKFHSFMCRQADRFLFQLFYFRFAAMFGIIVACSDTILQT